MLEKIINFILKFLRREEKKSLNPISIEEEKPLLPIKINTTNSLDWKYIIIHHSLTKKHEVKTWDQIKKFHKSWRYKDNSIPEEEALKLIKEGKEVIAPWKDIGYHFGIASNDSLTEFTYLLGRPLSQNGAHSIGFNKIGIGICVLGSFDDKIPSIELYNALNILILELQKQFNISNENVIGHRETYDLLKTAREKTCPGSMFDLDYLRKLLRKK